MDDIDNAINIGNNDQNSIQQPTTGTTMTTMTNATPVVQQIVEDYEPDPKWEMTTLEKASFDCGDILMDNNSNDEQPAESRDDSEQLKIETDKPNETAHSDSVVPEKVKPDSDQPTESITVDSVKPVLPHDNDCFVSLHSMVNANIQSNLNVQPMDQLEKEKSYVSDSRIAEKVDSMKEPVPNNDTPTNQTNEGASSSVMSLSSVDAHMESVIEHAVELGGGQQISQTLGHQPEDEKKAVEHIQREILGCRNPMESLAELASQQPVMTEATSDIRNTDIDTETREEVVSNTTTSTFAKHIKHEQADQSRTKFDPIEPSNVRDVDAGSDALTKDRCKPLAESSLGEVTEIPTIDCSPGERASQHLDQPKESSSKGESNIEKDIVSVELGETAETAKDIPTEPATIIEETVELIEETVGDVEASDMVAQPSPIVQEASSADEADDEKKSASSDASGGEVIIMQTNEDKKEKLDPHESDEKQSETLDAEKTASYDVQEETKDPVVEDKEDQPAEVTTNEPTTRRSSRRASSRQPVKEPTSTNTAKNSMKPVGVRGRRGRKISDHEKDESKQDESLTENFADIVERAGPQVLEDDKVETDADELRETVDETKKDEDIADETAKDEPQETEKSSRTLRIRAPKRHIEEVDVVDQEEASSKPVKRSRASVGQQQQLQQQQQRNKSFVGSKSAPIVKLPQKSSRATISNSDPATRPRPVTSLNSSNYEFSYHDGGANRKYKCNNCKYSTDRLNNIVFHHKRSTEFISGVRCPGILRDAEEQRAEIIRLQQTPKGNKRKNYNRYS